MNPLRIGVHKQWTVSLIQVVTGYKVFLLASAWALPVVFTDMKVVGLKVLCLFVIGYLVNSI